MADTRLRFSTATIEEMEGAGPQAPRIELPNHAIVTDSPVHTMLMTYHPGAPRSMALTKPTFARPHAD